MIRNPYGIKGGNPGEIGKNIRIFQQDNQWQTQILPNSIAYQAKKGERLRILTPGGGGWGSP